MLRDKIIAKISYGRNRDYENGELADLILTEIPEITGEWLRNLPNKGRKKPDGSYCDKYDYLADEINKFTRGKVMTKHHENCDTNDFNIEGIKKPCNL